MGAVEMTFTATSGSNPTITAQNRNGEHVARLNAQSSGSKKDFQLQRMLLTPDGPNQTTTVATVSHHSVSGKTDMTVHGQKVTMRQSWEGMRSGKDLETPAGRFVWRTGGSTFHSVEELTDEITKAKVASCRIPTLGKGDRKLEILAPLDESLIDAVVASWLVMLNE